MVFYPPLLLLLFRKIGATQIRGGRYQVSRPFLYRYFTNIWYLVCADRSLLSPPTIYDHGLSSPGICSSNSAFGRSGYIQQLQAHHCQISGSVHECPPYCLYSLVLVIEIYSITSLPLGRSKEEPAQIHKNKKKNEAHQMLGWHHNVSLQSYAAFQPDVRCHSNMLSFFSPLLAYVLRTCPDVDRVQSSRTEQVELFGMACLLATIVSPEIICTSFAVSPAGPSQLLYCESFR